MGTRDSTYCAQPGCRGRAEPENDGEYTYLECLECGLAFDFQRVNPWDSEPVEVESHLIGRHHG